MHVDAVLFDLFNTLVLLEDDEAFYLPSLKKLHASLTKNGVQISFEDFKHVYFEVRDRLYAETAESLEEPHFNVRVSQALERFGYDFGVSDPIVIEATKAFCKEFMLYIRLDSDALPVLRKLHIKYKLGLVTNFAIPELIGELLKKFDLSRLFNVVVISGAVNRRKPSPQIFEKALKALRIEPAKAVFVGDTSSMDIKGAKNVGIKTVLIMRKTSGPANSTSLVYKPPEEADVEPDKAIDNLAELLNVLEAC
jgi:HAD superfamily hydrolase (TIGR01509 family)